MHPIQRTSWAEPAGSHPGGPGRQPHRPEAAFRSRELRDQLEAWVNEGGADAGVAS